MIIFVIGALLLTAVTSTNTKSNPTTTKEFVERGHMDRIK